MALDQHGMDVIKALTGKIQTLARYPLSGGEVLNVMNALEEAYIAGRDSWLIDKPEPKPTPLERFQEKGEGEWI